MKKIVMILTAIFTMAFAGICMAADGADLNKQQNTAETFVKAFSQTVPSYNEFTKGFDAQLKNKFNEKTYAALQAQVKDKFGRMKEVKFYSFQRFDQMDRVTYIASFSKEKIVAINLAFNKENKMVDFALSPVEQNK